MNEDIQFLKELQYELKTQSHDSQASPRYWTLMDYKWVTTDDSYYERVSIYFYDSCEKMTSKEYIEEILKERQDEFDIEQIEKLKEIYETELMYTPEVLEWIHENDTKDCHLVYENEVSFIVPNTMFLTKADALKHIEQNYYHYSPEVHTYAMTAWRSPKVERLLKILENFDWDSINVKECFE